MASPADPQSGAFVPGPAPAARPASPRPLRALLIAVVALPAVVMAFGAWLAWRQAWNDAESDLTHTADAVAEFGLRTLSAHAVAAGRVDLVLRGLSDAEIRAREQPLHEELKALVQEVPQAEAAYVIDREGYPLVAANLFPVPRDRPVAADREFFVALKADDAPPIHVSRVFTGRLDGTLFFAISRRRTMTGNPPGASAGFDGIVNLSVYPNRLAEGLRNLAARHDDALSLVRDDGEVLARTVGQTGPMSIPPGTRFAAEVAAGTERALYRAVSQIDHTPALIALRRIPGWPVYAAAARHRAAIVAGWRGAVAAQLAIGVPATLALIVLALMVRRSQAGLRLANAGLESRVAERTAALAESEQRLRGVLSGITEGFLVLDRDFHVRDINPEGVRIDGRPREALVGRHLLDLWPEAAQAPTWPMYQQAMRDRVAGAVIYRHLSDRHDVWLDVRAYPVEQGLAVFYRDVTDRVRAEEAARIEAERMTLILQAGAIAGAWDWDIRQDRLRATPEFARLFGLPPEDGPAGRPSADYMAAVDERDREATVEAVRAALAGGSDFRAEYRVTAHGTTRWVMARGRCDHDSEGRPVRFPGIALDITERKDAERALEQREAELRRLNETLEARVRDEVAAREAAQQRLAQSQRMEALGQLAGGIAHDFNNVLQAAHGAAQLIARVADDATRVRRLAALATEATTRGAAVTRRLLAFSRRADLRAEPVDVEALLRDMRDLLAHTLGAGIAIEVAVPPGTPPVLADRAQLETVLVNLAANARDAMAGRGTLRFGAREEDAPPVPLKAGRYVRFAVADTGIGMDPATLARATEPFFTTKPVGQGTGLGLAMARGFAEQSGGALAIESVPGQGTTVRLWFPVAEAIGGVNGPEPPGAADRPGAPRPRVLLVDDEGPVREITADGLAEAGFDVVQAGSGAAALRLLEDTAPLDILVTDLSMPDVDGITVIRSAERLRPGLRCVLLTGYANELSELARHDSGGGFLLLRKPLDPWALAGHLADARAAVA